LRLSSAQIGEACELALVVRGGVGITLATAARLISLVLDRLSPPRAKIASSVYERCRTYS
jgi:hypothetical protein